MGVFDPQYAPQTHIDRVSALDFSPQLNNLANALNSRYNNNIALTKDMMNVLADAELRQKQAEEFEMKKEAQNILNAHRKAQADTLLFELNKAREVKEKTDQGYENFTNKVGMDPATLALMRQYGIHFNIPGQGNQSTVGNVSIPNVSSNSSVANNANAIVPNNVVRSVGNTPEANILQQQVEAVNALFNQPTYDENGNIDAVGKYLVYQDPNSGEKTIVNPEDFNNINSLNMLRSMGIVNGTNPQENVVGTLDKTLLGEVNDDNPFFKNNPKQAFIDIANNYSRLPKNLAYNSELSDSYAREEDKEKFFQNTSEKESNFFNALNNAMGKKDFDRLFIGENAIGNLYGSQLANFLIASDGKYKSLKGTLIKNPAMYEKVLDLVVKGNSTTDIENILADGDFESLGNQDRKIITRLSKDVKELGKFTGKSLTGIGYAYNLSNDSKDKNSDLKITNLKYLNDDRLKDYIQLNEKKKELAPNSQLDAEEVQSALDFVRETLIGSKDNTLMLRAMGIPPSLLKANKENKNKAPLPKYNSSDFNEKIYGENNKAVKKRFEDSLKILMRASSTKRHTDLNSEIEKVLNDLFNMKGN